MKRGQETFTRRFRKRRRLLALMLVSALVGGLLPSSGKTWISRAESQGVSSKESHGLSNPVTDSEGITTWDCVYFGNYWQNDTNGDGVADKNDEKEPIKWRVLSVDGDDAFLLADKNLDVQKYNDTESGVTWGTCTMRSWLNGYKAEANVCRKDYTGNSFLKHAFTDLEQAAIQNTNVVNEDNPECGTEGGNDTADKVFLLSIAEARNPAYGFHRTISYSDTRKAVNTAYVAAGGEINSSDIDSVGSNDSWWLRSPGDLSITASHVYDSGRINQYGSFVDVGQDGSNVYNDRKVVRPALHLNLSSVSGWLHAERVTSDQEWIKTESPAPDEEANREPHNPVRNSDGSVTWDCVRFGNYWQNDTNGDGVADKDDQKEPIKWRVLSVDGNDAFLLADKNLDVQSYNDTREEVTWGTCTMRSWLNGAFMKYAFTNLERLAIWDTNVVNADNPEYDTEGGEDTVDKVFLLSINEVVNPVYGFEETGADSNMRKAVNTAYVEAGGENGIEGKAGLGSCDDWWLRSPGVRGYYASDVNYDGYVSQFGTYVTYVDNDDKAIRPALHLNLSSVSEWSYAGTVTVIGDKTDVPSSSPEATVTPSQEPEETVKPTPSVAPTKEPVQSEEPGKPTVTPSPLPEETVKPTPPVAPTKEPVQSKEPGKPTVTPSQTPGTWQTPTNPVITPGSQSETSGMPAASAVQKPGKVIGLKLKTVKNGLQASWKKCKGAAGYEVWYGTSKKLSNKKKKNVKSAGIAIKKLKKKKTYYVKVRAFVNRNGKKVYGAWSGIVKRKVK